MKPSQNTFVDLPLNKNRLKKKTTKTETLDLNQIWVYIEHNLGVVVVFWLFWYLCHNERLKLHCKRAHLFVSYFVFFFSIDSDALNIDKKNLKLICTCLGLSQGC